MVSVEDPFLPDVNLNRALAAENEQPLKQALLTAHREPRADAARVAAAFSAAATRSGGGGDFAAAVGA